MSKKVYLLVGLLILLIAITGGYFFEKLRKDETPLSVPPTNVGEREIVVRPIDTVRKQTGQVDGKKAITYSVEGYFHEPLKKSAFWGEGLFTIKGDVKERKIRAFFGMPDGNTILGKFKGNLRGDSKWTTVKTDEVLITLGDKQPALIEVQFVVEDIPQVLEKIAKNEKIFDGYIDSMQSGKYDFEIPEDFYLVASKVGVVE